MIINGRDWCEISVRQFNFLCISLQTQIGQLEEREEHFTEEALNVQSVLHLNSFLRREPRSLCIIKSLGLVKISVYLAK